MFFKYGYGKSHLRDAKLIALGCSPGTRIFEKAPQVVPMQRNLRTTHFLEHSTDYGAGQVGAETLATACAVPRADTDFPRRRAGTRPAEKALRPVTAP